MALLTHVSVDNMQQLNDRFAPGLDVFQQTLQTINDLVEVGRALPTFIADARYTLNQHESLTLQLQKLMEQLSQEAQTKAHLEVELGKEAQARAQSEEELGKEAQTRAQLEVELGKVEEELGKERQANTLLQEQLQKKNEEEAVYKQKIATLMQKNQAEAKKSKSELTKLQDELRKLTGRLKAREEEDKLKREDMRGMLKSWDDRHAALEAPTVSAPQSSVRTRGAVAAAGGNN